jgi:hypothetical protein
VSNFGQQSYEKTKIFAICVIAKVDIKDYISSLKDVKTGFMSYSKQTGCAIWKDTFTIFGPNDKVKKEIPLIKESLSQLFSNDTYAVTNLNSELKMIRELSRIRILFDTTNAQIKFNF